MASTSRAKAARGAPRGAPAESQVRHIRSGSAATPPMKQAARAMDRQQTTSPGRSQAAAKGRPSAGRSHGGDRAAAARHVDGTHNGVKELVDEYEGSSSMTRWAAELRCYREFDAFDEVYESEARQKTVSSRWRHQQSAEDRMVVPSRLIAREIKPKDTKSLFAAAPPLSLVRFVVSRAATLMPNGSHRILIFMDATRAHLYARISEPRSMTWESPEQGHP